MLYTSKKAGCPALISIAFLFLATALPQPSQQAQTATPAAAAPSSPAVASPERVPLDDRTDAKRVPARPGDICLQCRHAIGPQDPVYEVHGHRIPIHQHEEERDLAGQLRRLARQFEPSGAFLQAAARETGLSPVWFLFGCYVLLGLIFAALCAQRALHKGLPAWIWFLAGLFFNLLAYVVLLFRPSQAQTAPAGVPAGLHKVASTYAPAACPKCGGLNHPCARKCGDCGAALQPALVSEVARSGLRSP